MYKLKSNWRKSGCEEIGTDCLRSFCKRTFKKRMIKFNWLARACTLDTSIWHTGRCVCVKRPVRVKLHTRTQPSRSVVETTNTSALIPKWRSSKYITCVWWFDSRYLNRLLAFRLTLHSYDGFEHAKHCLNELEQQYKHAYIQIIKRKLQFDSICSLGWKIYEYLYEINFGITMILPK